jgi:hypothetical protein
MHQSQENPFGGNEKYFTPMHTRSYDVFSPVQPYTAATATGRRSPSKELKDRDRELMSSPTKRIGYR